MPLFGSMGLRTAVWSLESARGKRKLHVGGSRPVPGGFPGAEASERDAVLDQLQAHAACFPSRGCHPKSGMQSLALKVPWGSGHGVGIGAGW